VLPKYSDGEHRVICPQCEGGSNHEKSLSVGVTDNGKSARWLCFRGTCGWTGCVCMRACFPHASSSQPLKRKTLTRRCWAQLLLIA